MSTKLRFHYGLDALPNIEGFRFRGWTPNGDLIPCVVAKSRLGIHYAAEEGTGRGVYDYLKGWCEYIPVTESSK